MRIPIHPRGLFSSVLLWLSLCVDASANDAPFGLPLPHDPQRPGSVMLHGGGRGLSQEICRELVRLAGGKEARILLMPSESYRLGEDENGKPVNESSEQFESRVKRDYSRWADLKTDGHVADLKILYLNRRTDPDDATFYDLLEKATGVWMPALEQTTLPGQFADDYPRQTSRFQIALRNVVAKGGIVGGLGGGMGCLPETIIAGSVDSNGGWDRASLRFGLGLLTGAVVDQNFDAKAGRFERLTDLLRHGKSLDRLGGIPGVERRTIGLGVDRQTAMILQGNTIRVIGERHGHVFLKSNGDRTITWRTLEEGDDPLAVQSSPARKASQLSELESRVDGFNPFGLPTPSDSSHPGTVVLHGGGDTDEIIQLFPDLTGSPKPRMVHCPSARESCRPSSEFHGEKLVQHLESEFAEWKRLESKGRLQDLAFVTTNTAADANRPEFVRPLRQANALWFCGGNQRSLASLFVDRNRPTLFQQEACRIVAHGGVVGGVVGGSSAGLAIMPDIMIEGEESDDGAPAIANLSRGLGVMKHVLAEQHFDARGGRIERLTNLLRDHKRLARFSPTCRPPKMIGLAVEEDTALIVQGNRLRVSGKKQAHVFLQSANPRVVTWHALHSGDLAILQPGRDGYVLELEDWAFRD